MSDLFFVKNSRNDSINEDIYLSWFLIYKYHVRRDIDREKETESMCKSPRFRNRRLYCDVVITGATCF